jgi:hypothetical protein
MPTYLKKPVKRPMANQSPVSPPEPTIYYRNGYLVEQGLCGKLYDPTDEGLSEACFCDIGHTGGCLGANDRPLSEHRYWLPDVGPTPEDEAEIGAALKPIVRAMNFEQVRGELADLIAEANAALTKVGPSAHPQSDNALYYPLLFLTRALEQNAPFLSSPPEPTRDTTRLDWLETQRASVHAVVQDEFDVGTVPELLRFTVEVDYYKTRIGGDFLDIVTEGRTLREAIDAAMSSPPAPTEKPNA